MSFSVSPWNIIRSMKAVDEWQAVINSNIVGATKVGYKEAESYFGGGITSILRPPGLTAAAKQIAEQVLSTNHTWINFKQGELNPSSEWMHTAVQGEGFFMTSAVLGNPDPAKDIQYTRNGEWHLDEEGFLRTNEGLYVMDGTYIPGSSTNSSTAIPPWNGSIFDSWFAREEVVVENTSNRTVTQDTVVEVQFDAQKLINTGQINDPTNLNDVRIGYYQDPPGNPAGWTELPREIVPGTAGTNSTVIRFRLQDDVAPGQTLTDKYFVYYQGPTGAPVAATGNQAIGLVDPTGGEDDFGGFFNPQDDFVDAPGDPRSVEDWVNEFGGERWRAGLPDSPSDTWAGAKAGHISYDINDNRTDGYFISTTTSGTVSVNAHSSITAEEVFRESDGMGGWRFVDQLGNEIMMEVINGTNFGGTVDPNLDFKLNNSYLNPGNNGIDTSKSGWEVFDPSDILAAGWALPNLTSGGFNPLDVPVNAPHNAAPAPDGSWNGIAYTTPGSITIGDSNFDNDDSVWAGTSVGGTTIDNDFDGGAPNWTTASGSLGYDSVTGTYRNASPGGTAANDSMSYLNTGAITGNFTLDTNFNLVDSGSSPTDAAIFQFFKTNPTDDVGQSGYAVIATRNGSLSLVKSNGNGTFTELEDGSLSAYNSSDKDLRIEYNNGNIKVYINGALEIDYTDASPLTSGHVGFRTSEVNSSSNPTTITPPGDSQWMIDNFVLSQGGAASNDYQYMLLRHPIRVSTEGITRDSVGALSELIDLNGFIDHDVSVFLRTASGSLVPIYQDNTFNNNLWDGSAFDPYDALEVGTNYIEVYATHEVVSPPNVPSFDDNASDYTIGAAQAQMEANGWDIGGSDPGAWRITDYNGTGYTAAGAPAAYGNIIYSTTNSNNYIYRGSSTWDDYSISATVGVAQTDDDMVMLWARVQEDTHSTIGPMSGYFFYIQRPGDSAGVGLGDHQIAIGRMDNNVPTILANEHTHPDLMNWFNANVIDSNGASAGGSWTRQHWNFKLEVDGDDISLYAGTAGNSTTLAGAVPATPLVTVSDNTYSSGKFAMKTISQVAWFDNIVFEPSPDRKAGLRIDDGEASQRGIQSIDAFESQSRYYTDGVNIYDRFGNPNQALQDADSRSLETTATAGDNRYRTSNADGNLNSDGDNDGLRDYDPGAPFIVSSLADVPIYETRLVQYDPNPGSETRISTDGDIINQGTPDLLEYPGSNTWNEYAAELNWGVSVPGANGDTYVYMRHLDDNNWVRVRYSEPGLFLEKSFGGAVTTLASVPGYTMSDPVVDGDRMRFEVEGRNYRVTVNNSQIFDVTDNTNPILTGRFALGNTRSAWYDDLEVYALNLQRYETWIEGFMQPTGPEDILEQMKLVMFADNQGLHYDPNWGGVYFKETTASGPAQVKIPGQDGAGNLHTYKLEASNVDTGAQITRLAAAKDVFDVLTKQFMVYTDTIDSTLRLFR